jgi:hypothetical protein
VLASARESHKSLKGNSNEKFICCEKFRDFDMVVVVSKLEAIEGK